MSLRFRLVGLVIVACGVAFCHGALLLWPAAIDATIASIAGAIARVALSAIAGVLGLLNIAAGAVVALRPPRS